MKKFILLFFVAILFLLNGCAEMDSFFNKKSSIKEKKTLNKTKNSLKDKKKVEKIIDKKNRKNEKLEKINSKSKKETNKLDNLENSLNKLNLTLNTKKLNLKKGNLLLINLGSIIHFERNKFNIKKKYKPELNKIITLLKRDKIFVVIVGHTDSIGNDIYNQNLSELRAREVYNYFLSKDFNKTMMDYTGYGEEQPIATNATPEGRAKNRRVELLISYDKNLSNYFLKNRKINKIYLNNHNSKLAGKVIVTKNKGWSKKLSNTEIKKLKSKFSRPKREELMPHFRKREVKINLKRRELIFKGER